MCNLKYLFPRMNEGSYGPTEHNLPVVGKISPRTWEDCRSTFQRKRRTQKYNDLVDLLIELTVERESDSHTQKFVNKHL